MPSKPELRANSSSLTASAGSSSEIQAMPIKRSSCPQNAVMARVCARTAPYFTRVSSFVEKGAFADSVEKNKIFIFQSIFLTFLGSCIGIFISYFFILFQNHFKFISIAQNIYFVNYLPMEFNYLNSLYLISASMLFSFIFSLISASNFVKIVPIDILRNK